jgi:NAD+ kinase
MGVNYGKLGFLAEIEGQDIFDAFERVFQGEYAIEKRMMLDMQLEGEKQVYSALNDVVIGRGTNTRLVDIEVNANGSQVESYRADGLILSTPTGSTAYSLSAGGPIIDPSNDNILMATPICPHSLHSRSIILDANKEIEVRLVSENSPGVVAVDGQKFIAIKGNEVIRIQKSKRQCRLIKFVDSNFFQTLRRKLSTRV